MRYQFGRELDGTPAPPWGWNDLDLADLIRHADACYVELPRLKAVALHAAGYLTPAH